MITEALDTFIVYFAIVILTLNTMRSLEYGRDKLLILNRLVKNNIDKIFKFLYSKNTNIVIYIYHLLSSAFFVFVSVYGCLTIFARYSTFSSMFFYKMSALLFFTVATQGVLYYQSSTYSKDRSKYLQS